MNWKEFLIFERMSTEVVVFKKIYFKIADDLIAGLLLSKIIYWFLPGKNGKSKLRIKKDGKEWLAKRRQDWIDECFITEIQYDRAIKILINKGFVETKVYKFAGNPTSHICLNQNEILKSLGKYIEEFEDA